MDNIQFSRSFMSDSLRPHGLLHTRLSCPSPTPGAFTDHVADHALIMKLIVH